MQNKGHRRTSAEQRYQDQCRDAGCILCRAPYPELDHLKGATFKHNKIHIGEYFTCMLCADHHRGPVSRTHNELQFYKENLPELVVMAGLNECRKWLVSLQWEVYLAKHQQDPPIPEDVYLSIINYR